jgi:hypothetical protein
MDEELWRSPGLAPFAPLAPPWSHVLGRGRMVVAQYEGEAWYAELDEN